MPAKIVLTAVLLAVMALGTNGQMLNKPAPPDGPTLGPISEVGEDHGRSRGGGGRGDAGEDEVGCCYGAAAKCDTDSKSKCERKGCEWRSGDAEDLCAMTTTTQEPGCCKGDTAMSQMRCIQKEGRESCERSGTCQFIASPDPAACAMLTTTEEEGCCNGNERCLRASSRQRCETRGCEWQVTDDPNDCVITTTIEPTTSVTSGCCISHYVLDCFDIASKSACDEKGGCEWIVSSDVSDCKLDGTLPPHDGTSTSEPWLNAQEESALMFVGNTAEVSEVLDTNVSLSTILLFAVVVLSMQQLYNWCAVNRDGYTKLTAAAAYQTA